MKLPRSSRELSRPPARRGRRGRGAASRGCYRWPRSGRARCSALHSGCNFSRDPVCLAPGAATWALVGRRRPVGRGSPPPPAPARVGQPVPTGGPWRPPGPTWAALPGVGSGRRAGLGARGSALPGSRCQAGPCGAAAPLSRGAVGRAARSPRGRAGGGGGSASKPRGALLWGGGGVCGDFPPAPSQRVPQTPRTLPGEPKGAALRMPGAAGGTAR